MDAYERQIELETEMHSAGAQRYRRRLRHAEEHGRATSFGPHRWVMRNAINAVETAFIAWRKAAKDKAAGRLHSVIGLTEDLKPEVLSFIACQTVIDALSRGGTSNLNTGRVPFNSLAIRVGGQVLRELRWRAFSQEVPDMFKDFKRRIAGRGESRRESFFGRVVRDKGIPVPNWDKTQKMRVGTVLLTLFLENTDVAVRKRFNLGKPGRFRYEVLLTDKMLDWLADAHKAREGMTPVQMPMLVPPLDWTNAHNGGYLTNRVFHEPLIRAPHNQGGQSEVSDEVLEAVNHLQQVPWAVNDEVLRVAEHFWELGSGVADMLPAEDEEIPAPPDDEGTEEQRRAYARHCSAIHKANLERRASRMRVIRTLDLAQRFRDEPELYFVMKLDFRGRAYPLTSFLTPQGAGLDRGLLRFSQGARVTLGTDAAWWLAIHGANCYGNDKVPMDARVAWAHDHEEEIAAVYEDPIENRWWTEADSPWEFLAWCLEWGELQSEGSVVSRIPVSMDGSNNGLQIFSLLLRDEEGAEATNCTPGDKPEDVYQRVADKAWYEVQWSPAEHRSGAGPQQFTQNTMSRGWEGWLPDGLPRAATKRPVMVLPYGGTQHSCAEYLREWARDLHRTHPHSWTPTEFFKATNWLAGHVWEAIQATVPAALRGMEWLHAAAEVTVKADIPIQWITPVGFKVSQAYQKLKDRRVRTVMGDSVICGTYRVPNGTHDRRRQKNGISPNFVHSLDAACMLRTVAYCREACVGNLSMIHDSFGTLAADAPLLARLLREAYVSVFSQDQLAIFRDQLQAQLPEGTELPPLPTYGGFDPRVLLRSPYFFS